MRRDTTQIPGCWESGKSETPEDWGNLNRLAEIAEIRSEMTAEQFDFIAGLTPYHIEARYGDYKERLSEIINKKTAQQVYSDNGEFFDKKEKK